MRDTMKGMALPGNRVVELIDLPIPEIKPTEVLVRIKTSAICGSDLHHYFRKTDSSFPRYVVGHEPCGIVEKVGELVTGYEVGQRVAMYHWGGCGSCKFCSRGEFKHCANRIAFGSVEKSGGDTAFMAVNPVQSLFPLPDNLTFEDGSLIACNAGTGFGALRKIGIDATMDLCIYGLGPVGLASAMIARAMGVKTIYGMDPNPDRRAFAMENGVDVAMDSSEEAIQRLLEITHGGVERQIETSGSHKAQQSIIRTAGKHGRIAIVGMSGVYDTNIGINLSDLIQNEIMITGSHVMNRDEFIDLIKLCSEKEIHFGKIITHRYTLDQAEEAMREFASGNVGKSIFCFE